MEQATSVDSVEAQLRRAVSQLSALPRFVEQVGSGPQSWARMERAVKRMREEEDTLLETVPSLSEVESWVAANWNPDRQMQPPAGTISHR